MDCKGIKIKVLKFLALTAIGVLIGWMCGGHDFNKHIGSTGNVDKADKVSWSFAVSKGQAQAFLAGESVQE